MYSTDYQCDGQLSFLPDEADESQRLALLYEKLITDPSIKHKDLEVAAFLRKNGSAPVWYLGEKLFGGQEKQHRVRVWQSLARLKKADCITKEGSGSAKLYGLRY